MSAAARARGAAGCVLRVRDGLVEVLTDRGRVTASLGGLVLARIAADPRARPRPGDWVALTWWSDGPVTVDRVLQPPPERRGVVVPLRRG